MNLLIVAIGMSLAGQSGLITGTIEELPGEYQFTEGPVWLPSGELVFSDTRGNAIYRGDGTEFRKPAENSNGLALDPQGRLVICQQGTRNLTRLEKDGKVTVLADAYKGKALNAPNDVTVRSDGTIFFTDPMSRGEDAVSELGYSGLFALSPDGTVTLLDDTLKYPNGLAFSPSEDLLYVADTMGAKLSVYDVDGLTLANGRPFCKVSIPDGIKVDVSGNVWVASSKGIAVFDSDGNLLETTKIPQWPANLAFGGDDFKTLYITARTKVYKVTCSQAGIASPAAKE